MITNSSGGTVLTASHDVNLSRYFTPGSTTRYNSLFEFGSEFTTLTTPGTYQVSLVGKDTLGNTVPGTSASFSVTVSLPWPSPDGGSGSSPSGGMQAAYGKAASAGSPVTFGFAPPSSGNTVSVQSVTLYPSINIGESGLMVQQVTPGPALQISGREVPVTSASISTGSTRNPRLTTRISSSRSAVRGFPGHGLAPGAVVMLRNHDNGWQESRPAGSHRRRPELLWCNHPGFCYFAIAGRLNATGNTPNAAVTSGMVSPAVTTVPVPATPVMTGAGLIHPAATSPLPAPAPLPEEGFPLMTLVIACAVIILIAVAILLIRRWWIRRQNPALFRKFVDSRRHSQNPGLSRICLPALSGPGTIFHFLKTGNGTISHHGYTNTSIHRDRNLTGRGIHGGGADRKFACRSRFRLPDVPGFPGEGREQPVSRHKGAMMSLFSPYVLGDLTLPNRMVMAPMTRCRALEGNVPARSRSPITGRGHRQGSSSPRGPR